MKISDLISEISMGPFGSNIKVECFVKEGIPVLNGSNLDGYTLNEKSFRYVTQEKADSLGKANAHRGDIIITHRGTLGQIVFIPQDSQYDRYVISQSQFRVRCNEKILPEYLVYYFHTNVGHHKLLSNASQVGVPALARATTTFQEIEIEVPDLETQHKIIKFLETIRKKIVINEKINDNLAEQLQLVYQHLIEISKSTATSCLLKDIAQFSTSRRPTTSISPDTYYSTENMLPNKKGATIATSLPQVDQVTACNLGDTLVSNIRPYFKKIVYCTAPAGCSADVLCLTPKSSEYSAFLYSLLYDDHFFDYVVSGSKGTKMPRGDKNQILLYPVKLPDSHSLSKFNATAMPILEMQEESRQEIRVLTNLRDYLLPLLLNGQISIGD